MHMPMHRARAPLKITLRAVGACTLLRDFAVRCGEGYAVRACREGGAHAVQGIFARRAGQVLTVRTFFCSKEASVFLRIA